MKISQTAKFILFLILSLLSSYANASSWTLNNSESNLNFISIKKQSIGEVHQFTQLSGNMDEAGKIRITVDLASVDSGISIRDERLKEFLFEITKFPQAVIETKIDGNKIAKMKVGDSIIEALEFTMKLHGHEQTAESKIRITVLKNNKLLAETIKPIMIKANDFELVGGIAKLMELAKLPSISSAIPVTAGFILEK